jgi:predicted RNA-binding protein with EMAP domain
MKDKQEYLEGQCEMLAKVCMELGTAVDALTEKFKELVENHNELVKAVNENTDWRADMQAEMDEIEAMLDTEIVFTPDVDSFRDKKKDH